MILFSQNSRKFKLIHIKIRQFRLPGSHRGWEDVKGRHAEGSRKGLEGTLGDDAESSLSKFF
jgi:hypothetical protein